MELELWLPIVEAPGYEVSTWGRVRRGDEPVLSWPNKKGYEVVALEVGGRRVLRYVHRLILIAFAEPPGGRLANHDDGVKGHNELSNLAWTTASGNLRHAWARGLIGPRAARPTCIHGHPRLQVYHQRDRHGVVRSWLRCARCRRVQARQRRDAARGQCSMLELCD